MYVLADECIFKKYYFRKLVIRKTATQSASQITLKKHVRRRKKQNTKTRLEKWKKAKTEKGLKIKVTVQIKALKLLQCSILLKTGCF